MLIQFSFLNHECGCFQHTQGEDDGIMIQDSLEYQDQHDEYRYCLTAACVEHIFNQLLLFDFP